MSIEEQEPTEKEQELTERDQELKQIKEEFLKAMDRSMTRTVKERLSCLYDDLCDEIQKLRTIHYLIKYLFLGTEMDWETPEGIGEVLEFYVTRIELLIYEICTDESEDRFQESVEEKVVPEKMLKRLKALGDLVNHFNLEKATPKLFGSLGEILKDVADGSVIVRRWDQEDDDKEESEDAEDEEESR